MLEKVERLMRAFSLLFVVLFGSSVPAVFSQLSSVERAMVEYVDAHNHEAITLLEQVVNINSGTMNFPGVREVGRVFQARLEALGFQTRWVDGAPFGRAGHLVAEHVGVGRRLLLIGHLDTVFESDSPFQKFELINQTTAGGPGACDMKGGDVVIVHALEALHEVGALKEMNITVVMTGDEEDFGQPMALARRDLTEAAKAADIAIAFESGDNILTTAVVARRSATDWELRVSGKPAHSSQIFTEDVGAGAIYEASRILNGFYESLAGERYLTFNPGVILGGTDVDFNAKLHRGTAFGKRNVVAEHAVVSGDLRTISLEQLQRARDAMRDVVARHRPQTSAEITFGNSMPPLAPSDGNRRLLGIFDHVSRDLGFGSVAEVDPRAAGAADISFTAGHVEMAIDGLGVCGANEHSVYETVDLRTLPIQTKRAAVLMYRLTRL